MASPVFWSSFCIRRGSRRAMKNVGLHSTKVHYKALIWLVGLGFITLSWVNLECCYRGNNAYVHIHVVAYNILTNRTSELWKVLQDSSLGSFIKWMTSGRHEVDVRGRGPTTKTTNWGLLWHRISTAAKISSLAWRYLQLLNYYYFLTTSYDQNVDNSVTTQTPSWLATLEPCIKAKVMYFLSFECNELDGK